MGTNNVTDFPRHDENLFDLPQRQYGATFTHILKPQVTLFYIRLQKRTNSSQGKQANPHKALQRIPHSERQYNPMSWSPWLTAHAVSEARSTSVLLVI